MSYSMRKAKDIIEDAINYPLEKSHRTIFMEGAPGLGKTALCHKLYTTYRRYEIDDIKQPVFYVTGGEVSGVRKGEVKPANVTGGVWSLVKPTSGRFVTVDNVRLEGGYTHFVAFVAPEREPTEFGLPMPSLDRTMIYMMPLSEFVWAPTDRVFFLIDEIDKANNMMQNVLARIAHEHAVHNIRLPRYSLVLMAGNRLTDRAGGFTANTHIKGRRTLVPVIVDHKEWIEDVAIPFNLHSAVVSFVRTDPNMLHKFDSAAPSFPSPRAWTKVGEDLNRKKPDHVERALVEGDIGVETANLFWGHLAIHRDLRSPETIIANPDKCEIPKGPKSVPVMWAEITALARYADERNADQIFRYFNRLDGEFAFVGYKDVLVRSKVLVMKSKQGQEWAVRNAGLITATGAAERYNSRL